MQVLGGFIITDRKYIDVKNGHGLAWIENAGQYVAMDDSHVYKWEFYARTTGVAVLQVWRDSEEFGQYKLVGSKSVRVGKKGYHEILIPKVNV